MEFITCTSTQTKNSPYLHAKHKRGDCNAYKLDATIYSIELSGGRNLDEACLGWQIPLVSNSAQLCTEICQRVVQNTTGLQVVHVEDVCMWI